MKTENKSLEMSFDFSLQIIDLYKSLIEHKEFIISKQLLRSGTSVGANIEEATAAQSRKDFISKNVHCIKRGTGNKVLVKIT